MKKNRAQHNGWFRDPCGRDRMVVGWIYNYLCNQCLSTL